MAEAIFGEVSGLQELEPQSLEAGGLELVLDGYAVWACSPRFLRLVCCMLYWTSVLLVL